MGRGSWSPPPLLNTLWVQFWVQMNWYEHQHWVSTPCTLMQVSNVATPNVNGKSKLLHPVSIGGYVGGSVVADQTARNPGRPLSTSSDLNLTVTIFVLEMMVHGWDVCPQCLEMKLSNNSSTQSYLHEVSSWTSKWRNVILILCPSSTVSVQVYTNTNN